ncbi:MAG TPA: hypothetical protein VJ622_13635 [Acidimicrobiia bacterium]|nr:hypothetical protein [Acidimicrobiia bacterium]HKN91311.1 hypothetical protein [Acidimicrobiia bacterium]HMC79401.1 hypothetical protein [Acidimicrobiia bacterium]
MSDNRATIAYVADAGQAAELAAAARIPEEAVDKILIDGGEDTLDELQDAVYAGSVGRVLIPSLAILGPDLMAQEAILASWVEKSIGVFCRDEPDLGADDPERRRLRSVLGSIEEYGKIPWVP